MKELGHGMLKVALAALLGLGCVHGYAEEDPSAPLESDWLELVKGYRGDKVGVELRDIENGDSGEPRKVVLAIPKTAIENPDSIEEVVVVGRKPEEPEPMDIRYEWLEDLDGENYGLLIHLTEDSQWPIRLFMSSKDGFIPRSITTMEP